MNSVLFPELGLPTTAMLTDGCRRMEIWSAGIWVTEDLLTLACGAHGKLLCLRATQ